MNVKQVANMPKEETAKAKKIRRANAFKQKIKEYTAFLKDEGDYDYTCILALLKYKIERTRKCIQKNDILVKESIDEIERQMLEVENLLNKVIEDNYSEPKMKAIDEKWGKAKHWATEIKHAKYGKAYQWHSKREKETTENAKEIQAEMRKAFKEAGKERIADLKKAFDLMSKNIWNWWD